MLTSLHNEGVKQMRALKNKAERRRVGLHLIEGERLVFDAVESGADIVEAYVVSDRADLAERLLNASVPFSVCSNEVINSISDTETPQGICAKVRTPDVTPPPRCPNGLIVAFDSLQDPGNLGTIIRTADAFAAAGILAGSGTCDAYSPKALRAAMGSTYHIPIWYGELEEEIPKMLSQGFTAICGHLHGVEQLPPLESNRLLVIGNEANGVSDGVAALCVPYRLAMRGRAESLNAAVAAAILIYELSR